MFYIFYDIYLCTKHVHKGNQQVTEVCCKNGLVRLQSMSYINADILKFEETFFAKNERVSIKIYWLESRF